MKILVINSGSSSLKYQFIDTDNDAVLAKGQCERIGIDGKLKQTTANGEIVKDVTMKKHSDAIKELIAAITDEKLGCIKSLSEIEAVGHRVVHGGETFKESVLVTDEVIKEIEDCYPLAPLHSIPNATGIRACKEVMGDVPQVTVFDTAFHQTMPQKAFMYGVPYQYYEKHKIRRYGMHGTSHRYVAGLAAKALGKELNQLRLITCHLGNGSSITAVQNGKSVDTSMGFTPLDGLMMGTRSGSLDPNIVIFIEEQEGKTPPEMRHLLNMQSGILGVSGVSSDFRDIDEAINTGNQRAELALSMFCYQVKKYIGSYMAAMGGVDAIIFTAGVGENNADVRARSLVGLEELGIKIDLEKNKVRGKEAIISTDDSKIKVLVVPTNEELVIAYDTKAIVQGLKK